jgi:intracellular sulfur oxidation DsrE/DsrF family protein
MRVLHSIIAVVALSSCASLSLRADDATSNDYPGDRMTLGDAKSIKGVFSVTAADAAGIAANLAGVRDMGIALRKQGVTPEFAVVFMGPAVRQLVRADMAPEVLDVMTQLRNQKVELNACSIALGTEGVAASTLMEAVRVVGDGLIAVLAYQQRGYGYVPAF